MHVIEWNRRKLGPIELCEEVVERVFLNYEPMPQQQINVPTYMEMEDEPDAA